MVKLFKYLRGKEWMFIAFSLVFIFAQVWLDLKIPDRMAKITQLVQTQGSPLSEIWENGGIMMLCAFGSLATAFIVGFFASRIAATFSQRLRGSLFDKVESFSMEEINKFSTASLITRSTNDITQVQIFIAMGLQVMIKAPILAVWAILKISSKSWQWTFITGVAVFILILVIAIIIIFALPKFKKIQWLTDNLNRVTRENLTGIRVVRAYNAEEYEEEKFEKANQELTGTYLFVQRMMAIMNPLMSTIMSGISLAIYWVGAFIISSYAVNSLMDMVNIQNRIVTFSNMIVFSTYAIQIVMAFMILTMIFIMLPRASVSAKRINEVLGTKPSIIDGDLENPITDIKGEVELRHVSFKYPDAEEYVIKDVSFVAHQGETVAFIGSTGSGKSTIINLVPRFYDATEGEVLVDGINVKDYRQDDLHQKLGYVPQQAVLFSGTVKSNVSYGDESSDDNQEDDIKDKVKKAIDIAQGREFVEKMDDQYDANIARGGTNVSGGQKQRIAIARAIYRDPEIFIFDDSFSALDYKTDRILRQELKAKTKNKTSLIVTQRIGTIRNADKIIVLDQGNVVGIGTHLELMKTCKVYQEIAYSQLSKEELGHE